MLALLSSQVMIKTSEIFIMSCLQVSELGSSAPMSEAPCEGHVLSFKAREDFRTPDRSSSRLSLPLSLIQLFLLQERLVQFASRNEFVYRHRCRTGTRTRKPLDTKAFLRTINHLQHFPQAMESLWQKAFASPLTDPH